VPELDGTIRSVSNKFDVVVLGLGGMGSAAVFHLASRGQRVLGVEQFTEAHDKGSSHGASRIIRQAYYEHPAYVPLVRRAYELWERLQMDSGADLLRLTGGLMIGPPGSNVVEGTIASATQHDLPYELLDARELERRYPVLCPRPGEVAVYEFRAGYIRPESCVRAHLQQAARWGAELHFEERAVEWQAHASGSGIRVTTHRGSYEADRLVIAPGAWAPALLRELGIPFEIRRHVMCWFQPLDEVLPFLPDRFPIYMWDVDGHNIFYGFPATDGAGGGVKVAIHTGGDPCTPETLRDAPVDHHIEELRAHLARFIPQINGPLLNAVPCMYTLTPDEHFVISLHPDYSQVCIAAGFSGHGFKFTSVVGEILADLAITGRTHHSIDLFSPQRFTNRRSSALIGD
jgi:sarcosine oxidase